MHIFKGVAFTDKWGWAKAITEYSRAIELDPGYAETYVNRGSYI